jgi:uncharacterized protein
MIAVDTNILIYAYRWDAPFHDVARTVVTELAQSRATWAIPWPCLHEFLGIVTHPRVFKQPSSLPDALAQVGAWLESPSLVVLSESPGYWLVLAEMATAAHVVGPRIHDARIAALCRVGGVRELWTADRDFGRFPGLTVRNPLVPDRLGEGRVPYRPRRGGARLRRARAGA